MDEKVDALIKKITKKDKAEKYKSWEISPLLKEMSQLIEDSEPSEDLYKNYIFIGIKYSRMGRTALSLKYYQKALDLALEYKYTDELMKVIYYVLSDRNYFYDDDCEDITNRVKDNPLVDQKKYEEIYRGVMRSRRDFKHDPVEMSDEYLNAIDDVERKLANAKIPNQMGSCYKYWSLKRKYLLKKGVEWRSPSAMNPDILFD